MGILARRSRNLARTLHSKQVGDYMNNLIEQVSEIAVELISSIQSALNMLEIALNNLKSYPNVFGSIWNLFPASMQMFAIALLIIGCFIALMAAVLKK